MATVEMVVTIAEVLAAPTEEIEAVESSAIEMTIDVASMAMARGVSSLVIEMNGTEGTEVVAIGRTSRSEMRKCRISYDQPVYFSASNKKQSSCTDLVLVRFGAKQRRKRRWC